MQIPSRETNLPTKITIISAVLTLISILIATAGILIAIVTPEIRCRVDLDDCQSVEKPNKALKLKVFEEPKRVLKEATQTPPQKQPAIIHLQNNESKYFEQYQVSIGLAVMSHAILTESSRANHSGIIRQKKALDW